MTKHGGVCGRKSQRGFKAVANPETDLGGAHGERVEREPIRGSGAEPPAGPSGRAPLAFEHPVEAAKRLVFSTL